jgi:outer membrane protein assembly factor BamB
MVGLAGQGSCQSIIAMKSFCLIAGAGTLLAQTLLGATAGNWPQWRGPAANGTASDATPPLTWSETQNVKWKYRIPGYGTSTPIIWGDQVFVVSAESTGKKSEVAKEPPKEEPAPGAGAPPPGGGPEGRPRRGRPGGGGPGGSGGGGGMRGEAPDEVHRWVVLSLDRNTGKEQWRQVVREILPHEGHHKDHGFASFSPVTDGERLYVFLGSRGLHCLDLKGKLLWSKDLGKMQTRNGFGEGGSAAVHGDTVVVNWDHEGDDFIAAFDTRTGTERWRQLRNEPTGWSTPLIVEVAGKPQVVVNATGKIRAYDLAGGSEVWSCSGMTVNAIPTPVAANGVLYATSGYRGAALMAIRLGRSGDLTEGDAVVWKHAKNTPYVPSPLYVDDRIYLYSGNNAMLSVFDAKSGQVLIDAQRVPGMNGVYASPVAAAGRVYLLGRDGATVVLKRADQFEVLATNRLDDSFDASPAIVGKQLFLRGHENLYCISE